MPHNVPFTLLGAGLLWFGWFGFNAGSALRAHGVAAHALLTTPLASLAIGAIAAMLSYAAILLRPRVKIDDALDVFACHGVAGIAGALLTGVFASTAVNPAGAEGLLRGHAAQVGIQAAAVAATMVLAGGATWLILALVDAVVGLRVSLAEEVTGIDQSEHGEEAYHGGGVEDLVGRSTSLGESVVLPVTARAAPLARTGT